MICDDVVYIDGVGGGRVGGAAVKMSFILRCTSCYVNDVKGYVQYNNTQLQLVYGLLDGLVLVA